MRSWPSPLKENLHQRPEVFHDGVLSVDLQCVSAIQIDCAVSVTDRFDFEGGERTRQAVSGFSKSGECRRVSAHKDHAVVAVGHLCSLTHTKLAASSVLPVPFHRATSG